MSSRIPVAVAALFLSVSTADAQLCPVPKCVHNQYLAIFPITAIDNPCSFGHSCRNVSEAPGEVLVNCVFSGGVHNCEVWPQGETLQYKWITTGFITLEITGTTPWPYQSLTCTHSMGGWAQVLVVSPFGLSSVYSFAVNCGPQTIEY